MEELNYRLPRNVVPTNYDLTLIPDMEKKTFNGSLLITISIVETTKTITLHSKKLRVGKMILRNSGNKKIHITSKTATMDKRELLIIELDNVLDLGEYELSLTYSGKLDLGNLGLYTSNLNNGG